MSDKELKELEEYFYGYGSPHDEIILKLIEQNRCYRELLKKMNDKRFEKEEVDGHEFILECFKALNVFQALEESE